MTRILQTKSSIHPTSSTVLLYVKLSPDPAPKVHTNLSGISGATDRPRHAANMQIKLPSRGPVRVKIEETAPSQVDLKPHLPAGTSPLET